MTYSDQPEVSVIICNYNYDAYLSEAVHSVLNQTLRNIQVIAVDDGSTDESRTVLRQIQDSRFQSVFQENAGQAAAFNSGFRLCTAELVAFLDSDDFWFPEKLERSLPVFDFGNISVVQHNLAVVGADSVPTGNVHPGMKAGKLTLQESYLKENHTGFFCPTSGIMCRKVDLEKIFPIAVDWKICADIAITRPLPMFGDICTLEETLGAYRIHGKNTWMNSPDQSKWIENHQQYVDYANQCLERFGFVERMDFPKSNQYRIYSRQQAQSANSASAIGKFIRKVGKQIPGAHTLYKKMKGL